MKNCVKILSLLVWIGSSLALWGGPQELPLRGFEWIEGGSSYESSGGGPVGDTHPTIGTGRRLVWADGWKSALDIRKNSLVADLGQVRHIKGIRLKHAGSAKDSITNLVNDGLEIYLSFDNRTFKRIENFNMTALDDGSGLYLDGFDLDARYVKIHSLYAGDHYLLAGAVNEILTVYGEGGLPPEEKFEMPKGLLTANKNVVRINTESVRGTEKATYHFTLWPYQRGLDVEPLKSGEIAFEPGESGKWQQGGFDLGTLDPGFYRLRVECVREGDDVVLWEGERDFHLVSSMRSPENIADLAPGDALVVTPNSPPPEGWRIDLSDPRWPLWVMTAPDAPPIQLANLKMGEFAVYVGLRGSGSGVKIHMGNKILSAVSRRREDPHRIQEAYFGKVHIDKATLMRMTMNATDKQSGVAFVKLLAVTPSQRMATVARGTGFPGRKLIFYSDGYSIHGTLTGPRNYTAKDFESEADNFSNSGEIVERYDFSQGTSSVISSHLSKIVGTEYPGQFGEYHTKYSEGVSKNIAEHFVSKGVNPIQVMEDRLHTHGIPLYAAYRMNAWYDPPADKHYVSKYWRNLPETRVQPFRGKVWSARSYAYPEVRTFNLLLIKEMLDLGVDGVHLEFLRHPPFVGFDSPLIDHFKERHGKSPLDPGFDLWDEWRAAQREVMTDFMRQLRRMLDVEGEARGKKIELSVRFDYRGYWDQALDVPAWVKEGLVDTIIPGDKFIANREFDLTPFLEMARGTPVKIYGSLSPEDTGNRDVTPEDDDAGVAPPQGKLSLHAIRNFVADAFRQGALGFYMFNSGGSKDSLTDWRNFRRLHTWDIYENPRHLSAFEYSLEPKEIISENPKPNLKEVKQ